MNKDSQPELYEEFRKLNLNVSIADSDQVLEVKTTLEDQVKNAKDGDACIAVIRE